MKKFWSVIIMTSILLIVSLSVEAEEKEFYLKGVEVFIGIKKGNARYGTTFIGTVFDHEGQKVGYCSTVLNYTGANKVAVCDGTNDIKELRLVVVFTEGDCADNKLVLWMQDSSSNSDVYWNYMAPMCPQLDDGISFTDCICPENEDDIEDWNFKMYRDLPDGYGPVAEIPFLPLKKGLGTTLNVTDASVSGWLCHNYRVIPRIGGVLSITLD